MNSNNEFKINKRNIFNIILLSLLITIGGIWFFLSPTTFKSFLIKNELIIKYIGLIFGITTPLIMLGYIRLLFEDFGFKITKNGFINKSNLTNMGIVEWKDIISIETKEKKQNKFLLVTVKDKAKYLDRVKNPLIKLNTLQYNGFYDTPIVIEPKNLSCTFEELESAIREGFEQYKREKV